MTLAPELDAPGAPGQEGQQRERIGPVAAVVLGGGGLGQDVVGDEDAVEPELLRARRQRFGLRHRELPDGKHDAVLHGHLRHAPRPGAALRPRGRGSDPSRPRSSSERPVAAPLAARQLVVHLEAVAVRDPRNRRRSRRCDRRRACGMPLGLQALVHLGQVLDARHPPGHVVEADLALLRRPARPRPPRTARCRARGRYRRPGRRARMLAGLRHGRPCPACAGRRSSVYHRYARSALRT